MTAEPDDLRAVAADDRDIEALRADAEWSHDDDDPKREALLRLLARWRADVLRPALR